MNFTRQISSILCLLGLVLYVKGQNLLPPESRDFDQDSLIICTQYYDLENQLAVKALSPDSIAKIYQQWSEYFYKQHRTSLARNAMSRSDSYAVSAGDSGIIIHNKFNRALLLMEEDDRAGAITLLDETIRNYVRPRDSANLLCALRLIGNNYDYIGDHDMALKYYQQCIALAERLGDDAVVSRTLGNIAGMYSDDGDYDSAISIYEHALPLAISSENYHSLFNLYQGLGISTRLAGDNEQSIFFLKKCLNVAEAHDDTRLKGFALQSFGYYYKDVKKYDSAEYYMLKTLEIARKINNSQLHMNALEVLQEVYFVMHRYKKAYETFSLFEARKDSLYNLSNTRTIENIKAKYNSEKKEREIVQKSLQLEQTRHDLQQKTNFQIGLILILLLLLIIIGLLYRGMLLRKKANLLLKTRNAEVESYSQQLEQVNETKNRWFVNVAHELRTPLTLIKAPVQMVLDDPDISTDVRQKLEVVDRNTSHLVDTVNEILDLSKMEEGKMVLDFQPVAVHDLVMRVVNAYESACHHANIVLNATVPEDLYVKADEKKLYKVLANFVSNAVKHTLNDGQIHVKVTQSGEYVSFAVADTGEGIGQEHLPFIFNRFYQAGDKKVSRGGTGIGLALCKEIAELHGGAVKAESERGKGSVFTLMLPVQLLVEPIVQKCTEDVRADRQKEGDAILSPILTKPGLLLVEDNTDMRALVSELLKKDFTIYEAGHGREALIKLKALDICFIISDVMMPEMDGTSFLKEVKKHENWSKLPFIHITALEDERLRKEAFRVGIDDFLQKPFDPDELVIRVHNLYRNYLNRLGESAEEEQSHHDKIIDKLKKEVIQNLGDSSFNVWRLADSAAMSERQIYHFLKKHTGLTPLQFIQEIKLLKAYDMATDRSYATVSQLSQAVGFQQSAYFSKLFEKRFGSKPLVLMK